MPAIAAVLDGGAQYTLGLEEHDTVFYLMRLVAFVIILIAIVEKNRRRS